MFLKALARRRPSYFAMAYHRDDGGVVAYNLYFCCQLKQAELEDRENELVRLKSQISLDEFRNGQLKAQVATFPPTPAPKKSPAKARPDQVRRDLVRGRQ